MSEAVAGDSPGRLTWEQIRAAYHGQWVLMVDVDWANDIDIDLRSAVVVAHGKRRRDTLSHVKKLPRPVDFTHLFIGDPGHEE